MSTTLEKVELVLAGFAVADGALAGYLGASFDGPAWRVIVGIGVAAGATAGFVHMWRQSHPGE